MTLPIRIMTRNFELIGEVDNYTSLQITRSWHGIGVMEVRVNRYLKDAGELTVGRIIFPHNKLNKAHVILHREIELDIDGKASENWIIRALSLKAWLGMRITIPPTDASQDAITADAESVMHHYVNNAVINPADIGDKLEGVALSSNLLRGPTVSWQSRFKNVAEELSEISMFSGLGWNIDVDASDKQFVFKALEGRNLTVNQNTLPPAIFSPEFNTLGQLSYTESYLNYRNYAIVAGQGEGAERRTVTVGNATGYDRFVVFVDARDIADETEGDNPTPRPPAEIDADLTARGQQKLAEYEQEVYLEGQALSKSQLEYERDYDLGDIVTLQNKDWGVTLDTRITEIKEVYEVGGRKIDVTFGNSRPTLISKIKQELSGMKTEMTR